MANILLTSHLAGVNNLINQFLVNLSPKEIVFIPTASNLETYTKYIDEGIEMMRQLGFNLKIIDVAKLEEKEIISTLDNTSCLCISGGNTFYLLQELKRKNLIAYIQKRVTEEMFYIGESAGSVIATPDIEYIQEMDDKHVAADLSNYSGLGIVDFYLVPHYREFPFIDAAEKIISIHQRNLNLVPINNHEAVLIKNSHYSIKNNNK